MAKTRVIKFDNDDAAYFAAADYCEAKDYDGILHCIDIIDDSEATLDRRMTYAPVRFQGTDQAFRPYKRK